ncbi:hypothetical protein BH23PAT1_BH23PAT1_0670 [soil metagenome]
MKKTYSLKDTRYTIDIMFKGMEGGDPFTGKDPAIPGSSAFEGYSDKDDKKKEKEKKKKQFSRVPLFEAVDKAESKQPEKYAEQKKELTLEDLFEGSKKTKKSLERQESAASIDITSEEDESKSRTTEAREAAVPAEKLDQSEKELIIEQYARGTLPEADAELSGAEPDSPEEAAAAARVLFLENLAEQKNLQSAGEETAAAFEFEEEANEAPEQADENAELDEESNAQDQQEAELPFIETADLPPNEDMEPGLDDDAVPAVQATPPSPPVATTTPPTPPVGPGRSMPGPGGLPYVPGPPAPPVPPFRPGGGAMGPGGPNTPNLNAYIPPLGEAQPESRQQRHLSGGNALAAGIIGYLIGRRRGRIKTEDRLLPIQKKLEKEVKDLQSTIYYREKEIERKAARQAQIRPPKSQKQTIERIRNDKTREALVGESLKSPRAERPETNHELVQEKKALHPSTSLKERVNNEQNKLPVSLDESSEYSIGRFAARERPEQAVTGKEPVTKLATAAEIASLPMPEVLIISKNIKADGTSAEQLYKEGRINQEGLRRVVAEKARGGNVEQALAREVKLRETIVQNSPEYFYKNSANTSSHGSLNQNELEAADTEARMSGPEARVEHDTILSGGAAGSDGSSGGGGTSTPLQNGSVQASSLPLLERTHYATAAASNSNTKRKNTTVAIVAIAVLLFGAITLVLLSL